MNTTAILNRNDLAELAIEQIKWDGNKTTTRRFERKNLSYLDLPESKYNYDNMSMRWTEFRSSNLRGACFEGVDLRDTDFRDANLRNAYFANADLRGANFAGANLQAVDFTDAILRETTFDEGTPITIPPLTVHGLRWPVVITDRYMVFGYWRRPISYWEDISEDLVKEIDFQNPHVEGDDFGNIVGNSWWTEHKAILLGWAKQHQSRC